MELNRLKIVFIGCLALLGGVGTSYGQTFAEFFNQKKTQKKYLLQQIAALEVYAGYLKKGYQIVDNGLSTIKDFSNGEFSLHNAFISSLKTVSPAIRNNAKVAEIIEIQIAIGKAFNGIRSSPYLSVSNWLYVQQVRENLWDESLKDLEELLLVITSGKIEMGDDERIERLNKVHASMQEKSSFVQYFIGEISLLIAHKELEKRSLETLMNSYEIKE